MSRRPHVRAARQRGGPLVRRDFFNHHRAVERRLDSAWTRPSRGAFRRKYRNSRWFSAFKWGDLSQNWFADATSFDNIKYIIRNPSHTLNPGEDPLRLRFFVKYNTAQPIPSIDYIRLNGRTICSAGTPTVTSTTEKLHISQFVGNRTQSRPSR